MTYNFHMPKLLFLRTCCWTCRRLHFQNKLVDKAAWINKAIVSRSKKNILVTIVSSQPNSTNDDNVEHNDCSSSEEETMDTRSELHPSWNIYEEPGNKCLICLGRGKVKCLYCFGVGKVRIGPDEEDAVLCNQCNGEQYTTCERCEGTGVRPNVIYDFETHQWVPGPSNADILERIKEKWSKNES